MLQVGHAHYYCFEDDVFELPLKVIDGFLALCLRYQSQRLREPLLEFGLVFLKLF